MNVNDSISNRGEVIKVSLYNMAQVVKLFIMGTNKAYPIPGASTNPRRKS